MAREPTVRQRLVLDAIRSWIHQHGYPPTIRELGSQLGIKSLRGVTTHLDALAKKGCLKRAPGARSIHLLDGTRHTADARRIPIVGRIRAGEPLLAQEQIEGHLVVDGDWVVPGANGEGYFALRVRGESMKNAGILEGDFVIVRQQPTAENGEIVVALLGEEATVKRFFREEDRVRLQPENPTMEPVIIMPAQPLTILGKVVAVFRRLP